MNGKKWTAPCRIYLDASGKPCYKGDPAAATLLVAEGHQIPWKQAHELGLVAKFSHMETGPVDESYEMGHPAEPVVSGVSNEDHEAAIAAKNAEIEELKAKLDAATAGADEALKAENARLNELLEKAGAHAAEQFKKIESLTAELAKVKAAKPKPAPKPKAPAKKAPAK